MTELKTESLAQAQQKQKIETRTAVKHIAAFTTVAATALLAILGGAKNGGWGYAVFNYDAASDKFTPDPKALADCGNSCHVAVKAKDYIFHPYQKR
jgi:hypothetical protein